jgi:hypothetical protein
MNHGRKVQVSINDGEFNQMNAIADIEAVHRFARAVEDAEARKLGVRISEARVSLARRLRTSPGTLENIRRLRTKVVPNWLMARIKAEFVSVLQAEINRLEHEITVANQVGSHHSDDVLQAAQAQMVAAKEILRAAR